ncbi:acyl-CoA N-acyltransferase [Polychaeton citri CBS 116435]|uniref:Acyl-CoA N-acyltransferase n=1 Tax=Polychaeton citri CBS 116435 TaxID=1314669 RepID=A0A9P4Q9M4_9PEZI|nr:acyl-CoA N-acyltransferase [Polychaeton citri CBS 116435]
MAHPYRSERLWYRAVDTPEDDTLFQAINADPIAYENSNASNIRLPTRADAADFQKRFSEDVLLGIVICLPPPAADIKPVPIGCISLSKPNPRMVHHRHSDIGIDILAQYQGQGYGSEAIRWTLQWGFARAGLHRIMIRAFGWNTGALRLYERLGFKKEGEWREFLWHDGKWWSDVQFSMLETEWRELQQR